MAVGRGLQVALWDPKEYMHHKEITQECFHCITDIRGQHSSFQAKLYGIVVLNIIEFPQTPECCLQYPQLDVTTELALLV